MSNIDKILEESVFSKDQFTKDQIVALEAIIDSGISIDDVRAMTYPGISRVTYEFLVNDYLSKGFTIDQKEFFEYASKDGSNVERLNEIIKNVYIGKIAGLPKHLIDLYTQPQVTQIKLSRFLVEKYRNYHDRFLEKLITININNTRGKTLVGEVLLDQVDLAKLLLVIDYENISDEVYEVIHKYSKEQLKMLASEKARKYEGHNCSYILKYADKVTDLEYIHLKDEDLPIFEDIMNYNVCSDLKSAYILMRAVLTLNNTDNIVGVLAGNNRNIKLNKEDYQILTSDIEITSYEFGKYETYKTKLLHAYMFEFYDESTLFCSKYTLPEFVEEFKKTKGFRHLIEISTCSIKEITGAIEESSEYLYCEGDDFQCKIMYKKDKNPNKMFMYIQSYNEGFKYMYELPISDKSKTQGYFSTKNDFSNILNIIIEDLESNSQDYSLIDDIRRIRDTFNK